jgi:hypothetical protein
MANYSVQGLNETGTANKTLINLIAATTVRPRLYDLIIGSAATPADQAANFLVGRTNAVGTAGASPTPAPLDPADPASLATAGITHSVEPTYSGVNLLDIPMNQRATFRWVASPGSELVAPATANNGIGLKLLTATATSIYYATELFNE